MFVVAKRCVGKSPCFIRHRPICYLTKWALGISKYGWWFVHVPYRIYWYDVLQLFASLIFFFEYNINVFPCFACFSLVVMKSSSNKRHTFQEEETVYSNEQIRFEHIHFIDNQPVVDLIEKKVRHGTVCYGGGGAPRCAVRIGVGDVCPLL